MASLLPLITDDFTKAVGGPRRPKGFWRFMPVVPTVVFVQQVVIEVSATLDISASKRIIYRVFKSGGAPLPVPPVDVPTDVIQVPAAVEVVYTSLDSFRDKSTEPVSAYDGVRQYTTKFLENFPMELLGSAYERIEILIADANGVYQPDALFLGTVAVGRFKAAVEAAS
jgi:hypothetical protein